MERRDEDAGADWREVDELVGQVSELAAGPEDMPDPALLEGRARIAFGLGRSGEALERLVPGREAGEDEGRTFYVAQVDGVYLAVREDAMRAYLVRLPAGMRGEHELGRILGQTQLRLSRPPALAKARKILPQWLRVAEGSAALPPERVEFYAGEEAALRALSIELDKVAACPSESEGKCGLRAVAVEPGAAVARVVRDAAGRDGADVFGQPVKPAVRLQVETGEGVERDGDEYRATRFGYPCLRATVLEVFSPLLLSERNTRACWLALDGEMPCVPPGVVEGALAEAGVNTGIDQETISRLSAEGAQKPGLFTVARGRPPADGRDGRIKTLVETGRTAGRAREDGSIDFREVNFAANVQAGQRLAVLAPPSEGRPGWDVRGEGIPSRPGRPAELVAGKNVRSERHEDMEVFVALAAGALRLGGGEISVAEVLYIQNDVSFNTGNLDFAGDIVIQGKVMQGFSVRAEGDIVVAGTVEAGTAVHAQGDVTVGLGIVGRRTRVSARGDLRAQFVQEATVQAKGDICLGNYAYHANMQAGGKVTVEHGAGPRSGSVMGGQAWALEGIEIHSAGTQSQTRTELSIGLWPDEARQFDRIRLSIQECSAHIKQLLGKFNLTRIDTVQIRHMVAASSGPRRRILAASARRLGEVVQAYQKLLVARSSVEERLSASLEKAEISVREIVYPNVAVRLGQYQKLITERLKAPRFHIAAGKLVER